MEEKSKVLVVEDKEYFSDVLKRMLERNYYVLQAFNAKEAINTLNKAFPDVVILDLKLPQKKGSLDNLEVGFNLLERVKRFDPMIPVIVLTGTAVELADGIKAMKKGAFDYILKQEMNSNPERLLISINNAIERRTLEIIKRYAMTKKEKGLSAKGERKEVTILYSDIRGFTGFSQNQEPEDVVRILNEYFDKMAKIITNEKYNGVVDKFIGDCVMAFFPEKEHAKRAVLSAIKMREEFNKLQKRWNEKGWVNKGIIDIGIGINTGYVTIGNIGSYSIGYMDYTVITNEVNKASRVVDEAKRNQILITQRTNAAVKDIIKTKFVGKPELKGIEATEVYEVIGIKRKRGESDGRKE